MLRNYITQGLFIIALFFTTIVKATEPSSSIYVQLQKLHSLKRVLYVAAHPDDENTRALAWFSLGEKAETAYFSLTRGDGGQNLIGNELGDALGVLRTQELLAARSHDHAKQYFSRAVDFGYSKSAEESFEKWGKDVLMADLVLMIRRFKPDIIITRFPPDKRAGHGHHTASALLALEAFDKANDPNYLPEQVEKYGTWKTSSVYWNSSYWWNPDIAKTAKNNPKYIVKDIGTYSPLLGKSFNEIGTLARSQHKCQGFGNLLERGEQIEYFEHLKGEQLDNSFFNNSRRDWFGLTKSNIEKKFDKLLKEFNFQEPDKNIPALLEILSSLNKIIYPEIREEKIALCKEIIAQCLGLNLELLGSDYSFAIGDNIDLELIAINRSNVKVQLEELVLNNGSEINLENELPLNKEWKKEFKIVNVESLSTPYWLREKHDNLYTIKDEENYLRAENKAAIHGELNILINGVELSLPVNADYKWSDPSYGERRRPLVIAPAITATLNEEICIAKPGVEKELILTLRNNSNSYNNELYFNLPPGWDIDQRSIPIKFTRKHEEKSIVLKITPLKNAKPGQLLVHDSTGKTLHSVQEIVYDHIPTQAIFSFTHLTCIPLDVKVKETKVAYIKGVEDAVPAAIRQLGLHVDEYEVSDLANLSLDDYSTILLGIRIYNIYPELANFHNKLENFVKNGGKLIMQYNTASRSGNFKPFDPLPFKIGRGRVTEEDAKATVLIQEHPIFNSPNKISELDFDHWVQERGLYFAEDYNENYEALIKWADKGEDALEGALIVGELGDGKVIYTGISFFRELPQGVIGAYRLFANILSY